MDRLEAMKVFVKVADAGSLSAAGRALSMPLATVSRKLSDLEAHLKTRLITRSTRQLTLTDAGRDYLSACRQILDQVDEAEQGAAGAYANAKGQLAIAAPLVFGRMHVVPLVGEFLAAYPDVDVRVSLGDRYANLLEEHLDVAVRVGVLPDSGLIATQVGEIRRVVCASPAYLARFAAPTSLADLGRHDCVTFEGLESASAWTFDERKVSIRSRFSVTTADAAIQAAIAGVGITRVLSYQVADALRDRLLVRLLAQHESEPVPVNLVYPGQRRLPMKTRAFIDFAVPRLRKLLAAG
jgi:DNA-binding transcriptional LysR family regulator